jgi:tRNA modification GTPase
VGVSAETGEGLEALRKLLPRLVFSGMVGASGDAPVLTRRRHEQGARRALAEVTEFRVGLETGLPAEVVATHLLSAETALEELLGVVSREEVLDRLFGDFCVGK